MCMEIFSDMLPHSLSPFFLMLKHFLFLKMWKKDVGEMTKQKKNGVISASCCNWVMVLLKGKKFTSQKIFDRGKSRVCVLRWFNKESEPRAFFISAHNSYLFLPLNHKLDFIFKLVRGKDTCFCKRKQKIAKLLQCFKMESCLAKAGPKLVMQPRQNLNSGLSSVSLLSNIRLHVYAKTPLSCLGIMGCLYCM